MRKISCGCAEAFEVLHTSDYARVKKILSRGKHPSFIGRTMVRRAAINGGVMIFRHHGEDVAVAVVHPGKNVLSVLNVLPAHRSHGLGSAILTYLQCNFARVVELAVPFFARNGYLPIGAMKQGNSLKTQIMVKETLTRLAGRIAQFFPSPADVS